MEKKKILLIENQYIQFVRIREQLNDEFYEVYPQYQSLEKDDINNFKAFLNEVRIYLNERYGKDDICLTAFQNILKYIRETGPEIIIIDHKLVGYDKAKTGIDLASALRNKKEGARVPILFLSRTPPNKVDVIKGLEGMIEPWAWIHKGYSDGVILESNYIEEKVKPKIRTLIGKDQSQQFEIMITSIFEYDGVTNFLKDKYTGLKKKAEALKHLDKKDIDVIAAFNRDIVMHNPEDMEAFFDFLEPLLK